MEPKDCAWMTEPMFRMFTTIHVEQTASESQRAVPSLSKQGFGRRKNSTQTPQYWNYKQAATGANSPRQKFNPGFKLVSKPLNIFFLMFKHTRNRFNSCSCQCSVSIGHLSEMTSQEENQKLNIVFRMLFILLSKVSIPKKSS